MKADITIIVPIYNVEKYVSKCLNSLLKQTYSNFEIWAVDDGSPDDSKEIVQKYAKKDSRIKLIIKKNGGYGSVLEYCIKRINTKYFIICDPDDWLANTALEELHNFAEKNDLDLVIGNKIEVFGKKNKKKLIKSFNSSLNIKNEYIYTNPKEIQKLSLGEISPHAKLFKTEIAKKIKFPHHTNYTDTILYILSLIDAKRVAYYDHALAYYLIERPGNTFTIKPNNKISDEIIIWNFLLKQVINNKNTQNIIYYYLYNLLEYIIYLSSYTSHNIYTRKYNNKIKKMTLCIQQYKKNIEPFIKQSKSIKKKLFFKGLMNKQIFSLYIYIYIFIKIKKLNYGSK